MSKTMSRKDRKIIQEAEEIIAEVKQNGLKDGALIVLRATCEDDDKDLHVVALGKTVPTVAALGSALVDVCDTFEYPLTRAIKLLSKMAKQRRVKAR